MNTLSASAPGGASIIFGKNNSTQGNQGLLDGVYPFDHASMGAFLQSCRGARVSITLDSKETKAGLLLMVERAQRAVEGCQDKTEEYFTYVQIFESGSIRKIPFQKVVEVSLADAAMQEQLSKSLMTSLEKQLPKPLPPPKDNREVISIRASSDAHGVCQVSYVDTKLDLAILPESLGLVSTSNGLQPTSNGLQPTSDGLQPAIMLGWAKVQTATSR